MKKMSNKKFQENCFNDTIGVANEINEAICYDDRDETFYTESHYRKLCEKIILAYCKEYTEEDWNRDKTDCHLTWFYPNKMDN